MLHYKAGKRPIYGESGGSSKYSPAKPPTNEMVKFLKPLDQTLMALSMFNKKAAAVENLTIIENTIDAALNS
jgi:hypothetical protein